MRFIFQVIFILVTAYIGALFFPWYVIGIAAFLGGLLLKSKANFLAGFLAIAILWTVKAMLAETGDTNGLATRVANIFTLPNKYLLYLVMAFIGGIVGGLGCVTGSFLVNKSGARHQA